MPVSLPSARLTAGAVLLTVVVAVQPVQAQHGTTIRGRVQSAAGQAIPGAAVVRVTPAGDTLHADSAGHYALEHLPPGHYVFRFTQAGFSPMDMELTLTGDTTLEVDVPLDAAAPPPDLVSAGFMRRMAENRGRHGVTFLTATDIAARHPAKVTDLLDHINDIQVQPNGRYAAVWGDARRCAMVFFIDGQPATDIWPYQDNGLDERLTPDRIAGMEIYPRDTQLPSEVHMTAAPTPAHFQTSINGSGYQAYDTRTAHCGAIMIWTK